MKEKKPAFVVFKPKSRENKIEEKNCSLHSSKQKHSSPPPSLSLSLSLFYLPQLEKKSLTSRTNTSGRSSAAKCPPELARVKCLRLLPAATQALGGLKSSRGMSSTAVGTRT